MDLHRERDHDLRKTEQIKYKCLFCFQNLPNFEILIHQTTFHYNEFIQYFNKTLNVIVKNVDKGSIRTKLATKFYPINSIGDRLNFTNFDLKCNLVLSSDGIKRLCN